MSDLRVSQVEFRHQFSPSIVKKGKQSGLTAGADPCSMIKSQKLSQTFVVLRQTSATPKVTEFAEFMLSSEKSQVSRQVCRKAGISPYIGFPFRCASDPQTRAGAAVSAMTQLYAALRPPAPATPLPWEQAPQPLGDRLRAFEARMAETAAANQVKAAQVAGERAMIALDALSPTPGGPPSPRSGTPPRAILAASRPWLRA